MKFICTFTFSAILLLINPVKSQSVVETIDFDNYISPVDNDLLNHFYGMQTLVQIPSQGITGGCLQVPDSNNWGNDNSRYCSKYKSVEDSTYTTSFCFYYDASLISAGFDRAASIWIQPHTDPNHYIIASVSHQAKIEINTYFSFNASTNPMTLQSNNWYKLILGFSYGSLPSNYTVSFYSSVVDLGVNGTSSPITVDSVSGLIVDSVLALDDAIEVSLTGARYGGGRYFDNFRFEGIKSADSCNFTSVKPIANLESIQLYTADGVLYAKGIDAIGKQIDVYDSTGKKLLSTKLFSDENALKISDFAPGMYYTSIYDSRQKFNSKFILIR